jgi:cysteine dioxygenase
LTFVNKVPYTARYVCFSEPLEMTASPITTIKELVQELLRHRSTNDYGSVLERYAVATHDLEPYFRWNSRHYTRTCIHRNDDFELLVICYEPGQRTSIHDYDSQTAWVHPVVGEVVEERFIERQGGLQQVGEFHRHVGELDKITRDMSIRRFSNHGPERAVTLNLYAKPMSRWRVYNERTGEAHFAPAGPPR